MKSFKYIFTFLFFLCCSLMNAQTNYKGVYLDRNRDTVSMAIVKNTNKYPVKVKFQYKVGGRDTEWINYINKNGNYYDDYIEIDAYKEKRCFVGSKIYGLNLIYVEIQKAIGKQILDGIVLFGEGVKKERERKAALENNNQ